MTSGAALRLVFRHDGDGVALEAVIDVAVRVPPSHDLRSSDALGQFYLELQAEDGEVLYRRTRPNPFGPYFEVPTGEARHPYHYRATDETVSGFFSVLVPRESRGRFVELFTAAAEREFSPMSVGRFDLGEAPRSWTPPVREP